MAFGARKGTLNVVEPFNWVKCPRSRTCVATSPAATSPVSPGSTPEIPWKSWNAITASSKIRQQKMQSRVPGDFAKWLKTKCRVNKSAASAAQRKKRLSFRHRENVQEWRYLKGKLPKSSADGRANTSIMKMVRVRICVLRPSENAFTVPRWKWWKCQFIRKLK